MRGIRSGIENTNYYVSTPQGQWVLTLFERLNHEQLPYYLSLMQHLAQQGILVPAPQALPNGQLVHSVAGKPAAVVEKMVEGRIRKYYEEVVLLEQVWVHDGESRVRAVAKKAGVNVTGFARFQLGEGIDKPKEDFAAEVAKTAGA
mgnify:CR=1 FL=1